MYTTMRGVDGEIKTVSPDGKIQDVSPEEAAKINQSIAINETMPNVLEQVRDIDLDKVFNKRKQDIMVGSAIALGTSLGQKSEEYVSMKNPYIDSMPERFKPYQIEQLDSSFNRQNANFAKSLEFMDPAMRDKFMAQFKGESLKAYGQARAAMDIQETEMLGKKRQLQSAEDRAVKTHLANYLEKNQNLKNSRLAGIGKTLQRMYNGFANEEYNKLVAKMSLLNSIYNMQNEKIVADMYGTLIKDKKITDNVVGEVNKVIGG